MIWYVYNNPVYIFVYLIRYFVNLRDGALYRQLNDIRALLEILYNLLIIYLINIT